MPPNRYRYGTSQIKPRHKSRERAKWDIRRKTIHTSAGRTLARIAMRTSAALFVTAVSAFTDSPLVIFPQKESFRTLVGIEPQCEFASTGFPVAIERPNSYTIVITPLLKTCGILVQDFEYILQKWELKGNPFFPIFGQNLIESITNGKVRSVQVTSDLLPVQDNSDFEYIRVSGIIYSETAGGDTTRLFEVPDVGENPIQFNMATINAPLLANPPDVSEGLNLTVFKGDDYVDENRPGVYIFHEVPLEASKVFGDFLYKLRFPYLNLEAVQSAAAAQRQGPGLRLRVIFLSAHEHAKPVF